MHKYSKLAAGSAILATAVLATAGIALADGYAPKGKVVYERPSNWSGVYFGVGSGYQWSPMDITDVATATTFGVTHESAIAGAHLGLQHQFGNIVLGVEGNWISAFREGPESISSCPAQGATLACTGQFNDVLTIGGRAGWAAGHWMPYVTGGYASGRFEHTTLLKPALTLNDTGSTRNQGWYIGGGVEWRVSPGWTAGIEYRHYDFEDKRTPTWTNLGVQTGNEVIDPSMDTIMARVSWAFYRPEARPLK